MAPNVFHSLLKKQKLGSLSHHYFFFFTLVFEDERGVRVLLEIREDDLEDENFRRELLELGLFIVFEEVE